MSWLGGVSTLLFIFAIESGQNPMWLLSEFVGLITLLVASQLTSASMLHLERCLMSAVQRRRGPHFWCLGWQQSMMDGAKLPWKQPVLPGDASTELFLAAP